MTSLINLNLGQFSSNLINGNLLSVLWMSIYLTRQGKECPHKLHLKHKNIYAEISWYSLGLWCTNFCSLQENDDCVYHQLYKVFLVIFQKTTIQQIHFMKLISYIKKNLTVSSFTIMMTSPWGMCKNYLPHIYIYVH